MKGELNPFLKDLLGKKISLLEAEKLYWV